MHVSVRGRGGRSRRGPTKLISQRLSYVLSCVLWIGLTIVWLVLRFMLSDFSLFSYEFFFDRACCQPYTACTLTMLRCRSAYMPEDMNAHLHWNPLRDPVVSAPEILNDSATYKWRWSIISGGRLKHGGRSFKTWRMVVVFPMEVARWRGFFFKTWRRLLLWRQFSFNMHTNLHAKLHWILGWSTAEFSQNWLLTK